MWDGGYGGAGGLLGFLFMAVFLVAVIVAVVVLVRYLAGGPGVQPGSTASTSHSAAFESPAEIVKRRYAAGEIDREHYLQMMKDHL